MRKKNQVAEKTYEAEEIEVILEDIQHIRRRPGMYIGSTDKEGWHHLFQEVLDNSIDEAVAGFCSQIKVIFSPDQKTLTVEDNGRGVPIAIHPVTEKSTLETIFLVKAGGKFGDKVYQTAGGLHGVGLTVVNALSKSLKVSNQREGKAEILEFREGKLVSSQLIESSKENSGLSITFTPDSKIFKDFSHFEIETVQSRLKELSYLNPQLSLYFFNNPEAQPIIYYSEAGLTSWIQEINQDDQLENTDICAEQWINDPAEKNYFYLDFAFQYSREYKKNLTKSFCNNILTQEGGTHLEGFESALTSVLREWISNKYPDLKVDIVKEDVMNGLIAILSVRIKEPEFSGQTKNRLANREIRGLIKEKTSDLVRNFLQDHPNTAEAIGKKIIDTAQIRNRTKEQHELLKEGKQVNVLPGKLADCISKKPEETELFIVEGESAGGTAKMARDRNTQAVLALQGKVLNVKKASLLKVLKNDQIRDIASTLGVSISEVARSYYNLFYPKWEKGSIENLQISEDFVYDEQDGRKEIKAHQILNSGQIKTLIEVIEQRLLKKVPYGKVILMTDADDDGRHIVCLLLTFLALYHRYLIEGKRLFLAVPPLYRVQSKKETRYLYNEKELADYRQEQKKGYTIQRFKGLGEMNAQQLRETTMNLQKRSLHELLYSDSAKISQIIEEMMGKKSFYRRQRLESGEHKNPQLTVENNQVEVDQALLVNFLIYTFKVVNDRALPQVEDGLKPVQRKILYTLYQLDLKPNKSHRKSSKVVGDVMGKFHPHGDQSIYQAMVKMAQSFGYRYPLVDGQGNWGSLDGDPAAAMRYTEVRLSSFGLYFLEDLPFETIEWIDNYDETEKEPKVLPANLNLLLNGSSGIAVGLSTNIPPHNLAELVETAVSLVENPFLPDEDLFKNFQGPDFPGGGIILEKEKLPEIYQKGEGTIYLRGKAEITSSKPESKKDLIQISELPFKVNKAKLVERISEIIKEKRIEGLRSVADYSNWEQEVNIKLKFDPNYDGDVILNQLYRTTNLQIAFSIKMRALIEDRPKIFSLREIFEQFISKRLENIEKKARFIREKNQKDLVSLETRLFIINNYQEVAEIVRYSSSESERETKLKEKFALDKEGINRILDTPANFRQFTPERREKLEKEIANLHQENSKLEQLITSESQKKEALIKELRDLKEAYKNDQRRTSLSEESHLIDERKLTPFEERIVIFSQSEKEKINNYLSIYEINSLEGTNFPSQGKELKNRGNNLEILKVNRRDDLWCFSDQAKLYSVSFYKLTAVNKTTSLREYGLDLQLQEKITSLLLVPEGQVHSQGELLIITEKGKVKRLESAQWKKISYRGKKIKLFSKKRIKCSEHQAKFEEHQLANCCDKKAGIKAYSRCQKFRDLQREIQECNQCQLVVEKDQIKLATFWSEKKEGLVIFRDKKEQIKQTPLWSKPQRKKDQAGRLIYCFSHQKEKEEHRREHSCSITCLKAKELNQRIKSCPACQKPELFERKLKKQINCQQVVNLLITDSQAQEEELALLLIKKDNSGRKKLWTGLKTKKLIEEKKIKKTKYCQIHWNKLTKSEESIDKIVDELKEKREELKKEILDSKVLSKEKKENILSPISISFDQKDSEKLSNQKVEQANPELQKNVEEYFKNKVGECQTTLEEIRSRKEQKDKVKAESQKCSICQGYCQKHQREKEEHQAVPSHQCGILCPESKQIQEKVKNCQKCQALRAKRYIFTQFNPLVRVYLVNKKQKPEIYLLTDRSICWYNKQDLEEFLNSDGSKKDRHLLKGNKEITDLKLYPK